LSVLHPRVVRTSIDAASSARRRSHKKAPAPHYGAVAIKLTVDVCATPAPALIVVGVVNLKISVASLATPTAGKNVPTGNMVNGAAVSAVKVTPAFFDTSKLKRLTAPSAPAVMVQF